MIAHAANYNIVCHRLRDRLVCVAEIVRNSRWGATLDAVHRELCSEMGITCCRRTVLRDLETLGALGIAHCRGNRWQEAWTWMGDVALHTPVDEPADELTAVSGRILANGAAEISASVEGKLRSYYLGRLQVAILRAAGRTIEGCMGRGDLFFAAYPNRPLDAFTDNERSSLSRAIRKAHRAALLHRSDTEVRLTESGRLVADWLINS